MTFETGRWYCVGWTRDDGSISWNEFIRYDGDGCFSDESGDPVEYLRDPNLDMMRVAPTAADHYALQP
ncbi:MAG: hypothetical protein KGL39_44305 [Patescibacteria group bacterium]|nr:hypothetical protein [Patescibacteria group bacterium]